MEKKSSEHLKKNGEKRVSHPNSLANLKPIPWQPGQSGNPHGSSLKARLLDAMEKPPAQLTEDSTCVERLVPSTLEGALLREPTPFREVWDRTEGKVEDKSNPTYQDNRVVNIIVSSEKAKELTEKVGNFGIFNRKELPEGNTTTDPRIDEEAFR